MSIFYRQIIVLATAIAVCVLGVSLGLNSGLNSISTQAVNAVNPNLKYFGYYSVNADQNNTNIVQIKALKNSNIVLVDYNPSTANSLITKAINANLKVIFHVSGYLLDYTAKPTTLRADYLSLISSIQSNLGTNISQVHSFYFDEPIWQGVSKASFRLVSQALRSTFPNTGVMAVEALAPLQLNVPYISPYNVSNVYVDSAYLEYTTDVGFDYFIYSCQSLNYIHQNLLNTLSSVAINNQKLWLVPDGAINLSCTNSAGNLLPAMPYYMTIATTNPRVAGLLSWTHSSYLPNQTIENLGYIGTQEIFKSTNQYYNSSLRAQHITVGKSII